MKWTKRVIWAVGLYVALDAAYVVKSASGIDLLPPRFGHHGWMFAGSDWAVAKIDRVRQRHHF